MLFDAVKFFISNGTPHLFSGHKHCQPGWVQTPCPFCTGNPGYHLGYNLASGFFSCWRCGFKSNIKVVVALANVSYDKAAEIVGVNKAAILKGSYKRQIGVKPFKLPQNCNSLSEHHKKYLKSRRFNPNRLVRLWGIMGTGPIGNYKHRVIIPIKYNDQIVSYQGRDITNKSEMKYKACSMDQEVIHHKNILYGLDQAQSDTCVLVEGVTDVWRLGPGAVCSFGIKMKDSQIEVLRERYTRISILFDDDPQAKKQAKRVGYQLSSLGCEVYVYNITGDPDGLSNKSARYIMHQIFN